MRHKTTSTLALVSFLIIITATTPLGYAYDMPDTPDMRLTWSASEFMPSIAQASDGKIWVVWDSSRVLAYMDGMGNNEIFYKVYDASKAHPWSPDTRLTNNPNVDLTPSIMRASDGRIWVVWASNRSGNYDIFYKIYDGFSWSPDYQLTTDTSIDERPSIMQTLDGEIWISWSSNRNGNFDIFYKTTFNHGATWSPDTLFPQSAEDIDDDPSIVQSLDGVIWIFWVKNDINIYFTYSEDNGATWPYGYESLPNEFGNGTTYNNKCPSTIRASDGTIWVVWESNRRGNYDIFYDQYQVFHDEYGLYVSWSFDSFGNNLTNNGADDFMPSITQANDKTIWIVWTSARLNNFDIYYRTNTIPQPHDVAIFSVTPSKTTVYRGQIVYIEVVAQNHGTNPESLIDVKCYVNSTQIGAKTIDLAAGQLYPIFFGWNTTGFATTKYTISAEVSPVSGESATADNTFIDGKVQVKIPGDINGDGKVDVSDAARLIAAWGKPNLDPEADINGDGSVNIRDAVMIIQNFG